jgi:cytochrome c oxidase subunit I
MMIASPEARNVRRWILLAVGSLVLSGLLAALLVIGRLPALSRLITDPNLFRRFLVVHVDLSLVVWLYAFIAALVFLLPRAGKSSASSRAGVFVSAGGVLLLLSAGGAAGARPVLANYVPMIDHWTFAAGLTAFGAGVLLAICDRRLLPGQPAAGAVAELPAAMIPGLRATGIALVLAALTFSFAWLGRPPGLSIDVASELANWGGGHVLALASTLAMISVWLYLLTGVLGRSPISRHAAALLFGWLLLPWLVAPLFAARGIEDVAAREAFTDLMRWGLFPPTLIILGACVRALWRERARLRWSDPRLTGFAASAGLTLLGWTLGALIRGSTTMIPAHYHASIGGVTVAFMAATYPLLDAVGVATRTSMRASILAARQPLVFGIGQGIFALGFAIAGAGGMGRKIYGAEQQAQGLAHTLGLSVMGLGGLCAIAGGITFLALVTSAFLRSERSAPALALTAPGGPHA